MRTRMGPIERGVRSHPAVTAGLLVLFGLAFVWVILRVSYAAGAATDPFPGNPPITPRWVFEPWVWEDNSNTRASTERLVQGYLDRGIPVGAVIVDSPWETYYNNFEWDTSRYPDPAQMIANFHAQGVRVILWITGFVNNDSPDYETVKAQGYAVDDGRDYAWWKGTGVHIDFTHPGARSWWHSQMDKALDLGADGWKVDMSADLLSDPVSTSIGWISRQDFKKYYYADFFDHSFGRSPEVISLARPYSSEQGGEGAPVSKLSAGWGGDYDGDFAGLAAQVNDVYLSAQLGYGAPGVEVGGFCHVDPSKHSLIRYAQFGSLAPLMENGGENGGESAHLPWYWDGETEQIYRYYATLHSELAPYLFSYSVEAHQTGQSILRAPDTNLSQHRLGEELFVSVLTADVTSKTVYFPDQGKWIDYWDEAMVYAGGTSTNYSAPLARYPVFIKAGAIIPLNVTNAVIGHGDESSAGKTTLLVYPYGSSSFTYHRPSGDGIEYSDVSISVDEVSGTIQVDGSSPVAYRLRVKSFVRPVAVSGADAWVYDDARQVIQIDKTGQDFTLTVQGLQGYGGPPASALITDLIVNDGDNAADWSFQANLQPGDLQYGDRSYTLESIGNQLAGSDWVRTANDSKAYTGNGLASFIVTAGADVYIAHNDEIVDKPGWLSSAYGWIDSGADLTNSEPKTFSLYKKWFPANATVALGPNGDTSAGMYTVIVRAAGETGPTPTDTPPGACGGEIQEAEAGTLSGWFTTGNDGAASGGQYVYVPEGSGNATQVAGNSHYARYCFNVAAAGTYRITGWVYADSGTNDSFFVTVDGAPAEGYLWDVLINTGYEPDYVNNRDGADPVEVYLGAGEHTVTIYLREDGTILDILALELVPAPPTETHTPTYTASPTSTPTAKASPTATPTAKPTATPTPPPQADLIFADGFESGNLLAWSVRKVGGGDLRASPGAALVGAYGMEAVLDDNIAISVADDRPTTEKRYRARFYFDPNSIAMGQGETHDIFYGYKGTTSAVFRIFFRYFNGSYQLRVGLVSDGGAWKNSAWYAISDTPHVVEVDWRSAAWAGANDGGLALWLDGTQRANLTGVDNDTHTIDRIRIGAVGGIDSGTRGAYYFDAFESRRQTYIGP